MRKYFYTAKCRLYFSHWCNKGYAIFAALGKEVRISPLSLHMYENVLLKSSGNGVIVSEDGSTRYEVIDPVQLYNGFDTSRCLVGKVCPTDNNGIGDKD